MFLSGVPSYRIIMHYIVPFFWMVAEVVDESKYYMFLLLKRDLSSERMGKLMVTKVVKGWKV